MGTQTPESNLHYPDLLIEGFRGFRKLQISQLGRVTLITGKNNTGKSSVLEALQIHTQNAAPEIINSILISREEGIRGKETDPPSPDSEKEFHVSALFHGLPSLFEDFRPIVIATNEGSSLKKLRLGVERVTDKNVNDRQIELFARNEGFFEEHLEMLALVARTEKRSFSWPLENLHRFRSRVPLRTGRARMPCIVVNALGGGGTDELGSLWDEISLGEDENEVIKALQIIDSNITAVSMIGGERFSRTAFVRAKNLPRRVPLRSFGDGLNHLFAMILSLLNARGGLLLIDEFENGLHHTVQFAAWRMIFQLSSRLKIQVFATSHSWDAVETFQKVASDFPETGVLLRLTRRGNEIIPTKFSGSELAVVTRDRIEVR